MMDPAGKIGGQFSERLTRLYESVREAGPQETLGAVRRLSEELGSGGVDGFIGSFQSIAGEEKAFLKELFTGQVSDPDTAAAGAKSLLTREVEGQLQHKRLEAHLRDAAERLHINPQPEPPGVFVPRDTAPGPAGSRLAEELGKRALGPQPEPPDNVIPTGQPASAKTAHTLDPHLEQRALGPQPEPPDNATPATKSSFAKSANKLSVELEKRHFDPQPEPPGVEFLPPPPRPESEG